MANGLFPSDSQQSNLLCESLQMPENEARVSPPAPNKIQRGCWTSLRSRFREWDNKWSLELAATALSIASLACIFLTLGIFNGRSLSAWKQPFSLNAVLAILGTVLKGSSMLGVTSALGQLRWNWFNTKNRCLQDFQIFDSASRGPLGSIWLLSQPRLFGLSSIGALVVILALASDSFIQAAVSYPLRPRDVTAAEIPIATNYSLHATNYLNDEFGQEDADPSMKAAIYAAALSHNQSSLPSAVIPICSTGNCTIDTFTTLEVESVCTDQTAQLVIDESNQIYNATWSPGTTSLSLAAGRGLGEFITMRTIAYPGLSNTTGILPISRTFIIAFDGPSTNETDYGPSTPSRFHAYNCTLALAIQGYNATIEQGVLKEIPLERHNTGWVAYSPEKYPGLCPYSCGTVSNTNQLPTERPVSMSPLAYWGISFYLGSDDWEHGLLNGNGKGTVRGRGALGNSTAASSSSSPIASNDGYLYVNWTNDVIKAISDNGVRNVVRTFENIAAAMTQTMRTTAGQVATGTATSLEPYVHVKWGWLVLPLILVVMTGSFVLWTAWQTRRLKVPLWKTDALAVVLHGLNGERWRHVDGAVNGDAKENLKEPVQISEMEEWAKRNHVRLMYDEGDRWRLGVV